MTEATTFWLTPLMPGQVTPHFLNVRHNDFPPKSAREYVEDSTPQNVQRLTPPLVSPSNLFPRLHASTMCCIPFLKNVELCFEDRFHLEHVLLVLARAARCRSFGGLGSGPRLFLGQRRSLYCLSSP